MNARFTVADPQRTIAQLQDLHDALGRFLNGAGEVPATPSSAQCESVAIAGSDGIPIILSQSRLLQEVTADNAMALVKTLTEPVQTLAPFSCARASLEASSLCCWLLDDMIDAKQRLSRSLTLRLDGIIEQGKLAREMPASGVIPKLDATRYRLRRLAEAHDIDPRYDKKGRIIGYGLAMPSSTALVRHVFGNASDYRIFSAVVHGQSWAVTQLGFNITKHEAPQGHVPLEKVLRSEVAVYLVLCTADTLARTVWRWTKYCGFDHRTLAQILDDGYGSLGLHGARRFWQPTTTG